MKNLTRNLAMALLCRLRNVFNPLIRAAFTAMILLFITVAGHAQDPPKTVISGIVVSSETGKPLYGATIKVDSSERKILTEVNGHFHFIGYKLRGTFIVSFVGHYPKKVEYNSGQSPLNIELTPFTTSLQEVVVSDGYQNIPKDRVTGSFFRVDSALVNRRVSSDIISRLEGVVPGLLFNRNQKRKA
jgi:hypothetical protein